MKTLICGALSTEMLNHCESIGLKIIHGVEAEVEEVLQAHREGNLDKPKYWLPGCGGQRRYRGRMKCCENKSTAISGGGDFGRSGAGHAGKNRISRQEGGRGSGWVLCLPEMRIETGTRTWHSMF